MRGIIFAAGMAKRLGELTLDLPKACLSINESETIIQRNLRLMSKYGFDEVFIVTGHAQSKLEENISALVDSFSKLQLIFNPHYQDRNNIYSAYLIKDLINKETLIFNSDIVFDEGILARAVEALENKSESFMIIDNHKALIDEDMKVSLDELNKIQRINKNLDNQKSFGEYIGILRLNDKDSKLFAESLESMISLKYFDKYYEDALDNISSKLDLITVSTDGLEWTEIDFVEDYQKAKNLECVKLQYQNN